MRAAAVSCVAVLMLALGGASAARADVFSPADFAPSVWSDKADYMPGEHVTLTSSGWAPGEAVHVVINDDQGSTWKREADLTADENGGLVDEFDLPNWFVATYSIRATGASGTVASSSFTDGNVSFVADSTSGVSTFQVTYDKWNNGTCSGTPASSGTFTAGDKQFQVNGANESVKPRTVSGIVPSTRVFGYWALSTTDATRLPDSSLCLNGGDSRVFAAHFAAADATAPATTDNVPMTWQKADVPVTLSATDNTGGTGVDKTYYTKGATPTTPTTASSVYDPGNKPTLANGEVIKYLSVDKAGNAETVKTSAAAKVDKAAPATSDDVPAAYRAADVTVTLSAADTGGSGVEKTYYTKGAAPAAPTTSSAVYSAASKPTLGDGERIRYFTVDTAGNAEAEHTSAAAKVDKDKPVTTATAVPSAWQSASVRVSLSATDAGGSGLDKTYFRVGPAGALSGAFTVADATHQPVLDDGEVVEYYSTDGAGNEETHVVSAAAKVDRAAPSTTASDVPAGYQGADVKVTLTATDAGGSGVARTMFRVGDGDFIAYYADHQPVLGDGQKAEFYSVDGAGNAEAPRFTAAAKVDKAAPSTTDDVPAGWRRDDVTVTLSAADTGGSDVAATYVRVGTSGEFARYDAAHKPVLRDGQKVQYYSVDGAGNREDVHTSAAAQVDKTAPVTKDDASTEWSKGDVTVQLSATDDGSGVEKTQFRVDDAADWTDGTDVKVSGDGVHKVTYRSIDAAGNVEDVRSATVRIDTKAPVTADNPAADWARGDVTVHLSATDEGSGVKTTQFKVDDAAEWTEGTDVKVSRHGTHKVEYRSVDAAGNVEDVRSATVWIDTKAPVTKDDASTDWSKGEVTVHLSATDEGSGIKRTEFKVDDAADWTDGAEVKVAGEGVHEVAYRSVDNAGNVEDTKSATVRIDTTDPAITYAGQSPPANAKGWNSSDVTATWTCADPGGSGAKDTQVSRPLTAEAAGQSARATCVDAAGNTASDTRGGFNIDKTAPKVAVTEVADRKQYTLGAVPAAACETTDALSGVDVAAKVTVTGGKANGVGTFTATCAGAVDNAGNKAAAASVTYSVIYRWDGFLQPINDTAHQTGLSTSVFKAGSTVPAKLELKDAAGNVVQTTTAPEWLAPVKGGATTAAVDESLYTDPVTAGGAYRLSGTQYLYNWGTAKNQAGSYWRIGVRLDDGQTYSVNIGLR